MVTDSVFLLKPILKFNWRTILMVLKSYKYYSLKKQESILGVLCYFLNTVLMNIFYCICQGLNKIQKMKTVILFINILDLQINKGA